MKKLLLGLSTSLILASKYAEIVQYWGYGSAIFAVALLFLISMGVLAHISLGMDGRWRTAILSLSILSSITAIAWIFNTAAILNLLWGILGFTALFLALYNSSHYEIKKYPAFGYAFSVVYVLTESISIARGDYFQPFFLVYLSITVPMYLVGIKKIRD